MLWGKRKDNTNNIFRMNGFTAMCNAKESQNYSTAEIARLIGEDADQVERCFYLGYQKVDYKTIIKVGELLCVPVSHYFKEEYADNMPELVKEFYDILIGSKVTYAKEPEPKSELRRSRLTVGEVNEIIALHQHGKRYVDIATEVGVSTSSVHRVLYKHNLTPNKKRSNRGRGLAELTPGQRSENGKKGAAVRWEKKEAHVLAQPAPATGPEVITVIPIEEPDHWALDAVRSALSNIVELHIITKNCVIKVSKK